MADRTPVVLALLAHALQARAADRPDDHDLHALADGVALAVDHGAAAALWPSSGTDERIAEWCVNIISGACDWHPGASDDARREEVAVARRLADVAASLRVRGEPMRREAEALWGAASRLLGFEKHAPDPEPPTYGVRLADSMAEVMCLRADLSSMTEQRDILKRQLEELLADVRKGDGLNQTKRQRFIGGRWVDVKPQDEAEAHEPDPDCRDSYRGTVLRAGAKDCALFIGPKRTDLTFVVEMREGAKVFDVVAALEHEHGLSPESYRIREVRTPLA